MENRRIVWMLAAALAAVLVLGACNAFPLPEADDPAADPADEPADGEVEDPADEPLPEITDGSVAAPGDVLSAVAAAVSAEYGVGAAEVTVVSAEQVEWTDSCLGLGGPAESCLAAMTPGYRVIVEVGGEQIEVRTDTTGQAVRIAPGTL